jgi:hypothetical protein
VDVNDLSWVAGFLEGEGCFDVNHPEKRGGYPRIQITSTDVDVLEKFKRIVGFGGLDGPHKVRRATHRPTYRWTSSESAKVIALMRDIYPMMGSRRRERIEFVLEHTGQSGV